MQQDDGVTTPDAKQAPPKKDGPVIEEALIQLGSTVGTEARASSTAGARTKMKMHKRADSKRGNPHHFHVPNDEMDLLIETVNSGDFGWKADVCMLQTHHHMYDADKCGKKDEKPVNLAQNSNSNSEGDEMISWDENRFVGAD